MRKMKNNEEIGKRMRSARILAGLTQKDLADILGVEFHAISKWENNPGAVTFAKMERYAEACGVSLSYFFE